MTVALVYGRNVFATGVDRYARMLSRHLPEAGVEVAEVPLTRREWRVLGRPVGGFASLWAQRLTARLGDWELVHALDPAVATRESDLVSVHDIVVEMFPHWYQRDVASKLDWSLTRAITRRAPHILASSEVTRQQLIERWGRTPEDVHMVHLGIDHTHFRPASGDAPFLAPDKPNLVYLGDDNPRKNVGLVVEALALLKERDGLDVRFVRMGPSRFPHVHEPYRTLAKEKGVDLVEPGFVDDAALPLVFSQASAYVWPTLAEGFGFPPIEAMACGAPVVAMDTPINREICGGVSRYHPNTAEAAAAAIQDALENPPPRERLLEHARSFDWRRCAKETARVYERVGRR